MTSHYDRFSDIKRSQMEGMIFIITDEERSSSESDEVIYDHLTPSKLM